MVTASTPADAKGLLTASIRDNNPVVFFEQKLLYRVKGDVPEGEHVVPLGKSHVVRPGTDITVVTYGRMLQLCLDVAEEMAADGISLEVVDPSTLYPMDVNTIVESVKKTTRLLIVHEACQTGGLGGEIAAAVTGSDAFFYLDAPIKRVCGLDVPIPYCPELERNVVPTTEKIRDAMRDLMR